MYNGQYNKNQRIAALLPIWLMTMWAFYSMLNVISANSSPLRLFLAIGGFIIILFLALLAAWAFYRDYKNFQ